MSAVQAPLYGERGILPALPARGMESGEFGEFRLFGGDDCAAVCDDFILAVFLSGFYFPLSWRLSFSRLFHHRFL